MENPVITIAERKTLSDDHYTLEKITFAYSYQGKTETQSREVYERGNGASVLLYNRENRTVILIRQFRLPTLLNGNPSGMLIEACAGLVEEGDPADTAKREALEETGYRIGKVEKAFSTYMSPGAVTEILHCFVAEYDKSMKLGAGGGLEEEHEHIEVLELPFPEALDMVATGAISDAKTIMLLQYVQIKGLCG